MKKIFSVVALGAALLSPTLALAADDLADKYFTGKNPTLTPQERAAIDIAKRWNAGAATGMKPVAGSNGAIKFLFGAQQPSIVCAVLARVSAPASFCRQPMYRITAALTSSRRASMRVVVSASGLAPGS